jgi:hypothetical protein
MFLQFSRHCNETKMHSLPFQSSICSVAQWLPFAFVFRLCCESSPLRGCLLRMGCSTITLKGGAEDILLYWAGCFCEGVFNTEGRNSDSFNELDVKIVDYVLCNQLSCYVSVLSITVQSVCQVIFESMGLCFWVCEFQRWRGTPQLWPWNVYVIAFQYSLQHT